MKEKVKNAFLEVNWPEILHKVLLVIFAFYISLAIVGYSTLSNLNKGDSFIIFQHFFLISGIISLLGFSCYFTYYLSGRNILKIISVYLVYLIIFYFLLITQNINNENFKFWSLDKNHFFEYSGFVAIVVTFIVSFVIKYFTSKFYLTEKLTIFFQDYQYSESPIYYVIIFSICSDSRFQSTFNGVGNGILRNAEASQYITHLIINWGLTFFFLYFCTKFSIQAIQSLKENTPSLSLAIVTSLFLGIIFNYTIQLGIRGDSPLLRSYIFNGATLYQIGFLTVYFLILYLIINRYVSTTVFLIILGTTVSFINYFKEVMRSEPLLITDFVWIKEPTFLLSFVDSTTVIMGIILLLLAIGLVFFFRKRVLPGKILKKKRYRISILVTLLVSIFSIYIVFQNEKDNKVIGGIPVISSLNNDINIAYMGFDTNARYKSLMYVWTKQLTKKIMETPDNYSQETIESIVEKYTVLADTINQTRNNDISNQTVIYILSESLADPEYVEGVSVSTDVLSNIKEIKSSTTSGLMHSDGYGGGTANMEFQALTGLPYTNYSSSVSTLYTEVVPKISNLPSISNLFESSNRYVIHPSAASNYSRNSVYAKLGFEHRIFSSGGTEEFDNDENVGVYTSDEAVYDEILSKIDTSENQFFSVITMQNHAPWSISYPDEIVASGVGFTDEENDNLTEYARLLSQTDYSTFSFLSDLTQIDKEITVVFYGDHLPGLYPDSAFISNPESKYQTDYFIWSNYSGEQLNYPYVSSSDFTAEMLEHTNSKVSPYYALLTSVLENKNTPSNELSEEQKQAEEDLKLIQYDISVGKNYIGKSTGFYEIK